MSSLKGSCVELDIKVTLNVAAHIGYEDADPMKIR